MGALTNATRIDILKLVTGQSTSIFTSTALTNIYCKLTTSTPTDTTAGTECAATDYDPVDTKGDWGTPAGDPPSVSNSAKVDFGTATSDWGTLTGFELWTSSDTSGTRLAWGSLTTSKNPTNGDPVSFAIGDLTVNAPDPS